jgi:hypothetical protein
MTTKADLHRLVDELPDAAADEAARRLTELRDPVLAALLNAPDDDEPVTDEDLTAIAEAEEDIARGDVLTLAEWRRQRTG